jgi:hypothetical protein
MTLSWKPEDAVNFIRDQIRDREGYGIRPNDKHWSDKEILHLLYRPSEEMVVIALLRLTIEEWEASGIKESDGFSVAELMRLWEERIAWIEAGAPDNLKSQWRLPFRHGPKKRWRLDFYPPIV